MTEFSLHPTIAELTLPIGDLPLSRLFLMNDTTYPWLLLVPRRADAVEIADMAHDDRALLIEEIALVSAALREVAPCDKLNVGSLGNHVTQMHVHVVARNAGDPAWPGPVWGKGPAVPYAADAAEAFIVRLADALQDSGVDLSAPA